MKCISNVVLKGIFGQCTQGKEQSGSVIFLHGGPGGNHQLIAPFFPADKINGKWYFIDIPNHGKSIGTDGDWSSEACLQILDAFATELETPLHVAGHSWGALVALEWAATRPELFQSLICIAGPGNYEEIAKHQQTVISQMPSHIHKLMEKLEQATGLQAETLANQLWLETLPIWMEGNPGLNNYREETIGFFSDSAVAASYGQHWLLPRLNPPVIRSFFERLSIPALLIRGADDRMGNDACAMDYYLDNTQADIHILEKAGHCPFVDQPDLFFSIVNDFIQSSKTTVNPSEEGRD